MLPSVSAALSGDIVFEERPSHTFRLDAGRRIVLGFTDYQEAMKQAIYLALSTERFKWPIFSWNYGVELDGLFGMPLSWVVPEAERRITEALLQDTRVKAVDGFAFDIGKRSVTVSFVAHTIYGDIPAEKAVAY